MINIKDVPKTWTGNTCINCGDILPQLKLWDSPRGT